MKMPELAVALLVCLPAPALAQEEAPYEEPDPKVVEKALADLEEAFDDKELTAEGRAQAIQLNAYIPHEDLIEFFADTLKDWKELEPRQAAVEALRYSPHPDALEALHTRWKRDKKKLKKEPELAAAVLRAMAQHGKEESIDYLADDLFSIKTRAAVRARILGLGHVRAERSVEELMGIMKSARRNSIQNYMTDFRVSLMVLTGADHGLGQNEWIAWWNDNKKTFEVREKPHLLPKKEQYAWDRYWGYDRMENRGKKREDRGDDPETDDPRMDGPSQGTGG